MGTLTRTLDSILEKIYGNHSPSLVPGGVTGDIWPMPANLQAPPIQPTDYFLHYFQSQGYGPTKNECVTTSVVMSMNMIADRLASREGNSIQFVSDLRLEDYARELDAGGISAWKYRFGTRSPLPGMMTPWQAINAFRDQAGRLKEKYGVSYSVEIQSGRTTLDLVQNLKARRITLIHGAWPISLGGPENAQLALVGGMPHTMLLVGFRADHDLWLLLNPAAPWLTERPATLPATLYQMTTQQLTTFWGRKFLFYPPRFSMTTITPDS